MEITLAQLPLDKMAVVTEILTNESLKSRLHDYGLVPGTIVRCRYRSPDGSVLALEFRGSVVAVRAKDLQRVRGCGLWKS
ncbi:MAG: ferrous iron transport protein A [Oscillospiraceae bacterium]|nr:ferrous iron transport protein A [Oscillospiraceae bacterium]